MKNNLINISKGLLLFGIIANSTMNLVKAEESKSQETNSSKNIIWTRVNNKTYKTLDSKIKERFKDQKNKNIELKISPKNRAKKSSKPSNHDKALSKILSNKEKITLERIDYLIRNNSHELKMLEKRIQEAKYLIRSEVSAWYPNLNLSSTGLPQYTIGNTYNELSTDTSNRQAKASLKATLKWDLINPSRIPEIELARDQFEKAELAYSIKLRELLLDAYIQFFNLQKSIQDIRIANDSIKFSETSLKEAIIRKNAGLGAKFDVLEARTQLSKDKQFLVEKIGSKKINERKLAQLINLKSNITPTINAMPNIIGLWDNSLNESIDKGLRYRQEIDDIQLGVSINNNKANISIATNKPTVSIFNSVDGSIARGEIGVASPRTENNINSTNTTIGIQLNWPIYDGGYGKAKYSASKEKVKEVEAKLALKKSQIKKEIEESFFKLDIAKENIKNSYDAIKSAKEALRLSVLRLEAGITTQREVVNNQRDLTQAEVNYVQALTDYNIHIISLKSKTGVKELKHCTKKIYRNNSNINKPQGNLPSNHLSLIRDSCIELL